MKTKSKNAFTLIESVIIMILLSIIVSLFYSVIKPTNIKEQANNELFENTLTELENVTKLVIINESEDKTFNTLKKIDKTGTFTVSKDNTNTSTEELVKLYKKYLSDKRLPSAIDSSKNKNAMIYLKNDVLVEFNFKKEASCDSVFTEETEIKQAKCDWGHITLYLNNTGLKERAGLDYIQIPLSAYGFDFDPELVTTP